MCYYKDFGNIITVIMSSNVLPPEIKCVFVFKEFIPTAHRSTTRKKYNKNFKMSNFDG